MVLVGLLGCWLYRKFSMAPAAGITVDVGGTGTGARTLYFAYVGCLGDLPFQAKIWKQQRNFQCTDCCPFCLATRDDLWDVSDQPSCEMCLRHGWRIQFLARSLAWRLLQWPDMTSFTLDSWGWQGIFMHPPLCCYAETLASGLVVVEITWPPGRQAHMMIFAISVEASGRPPM